MSIGTQTVAILHDETSAFGPRWTRTATSVLARHYGPRGMWADCGFAPIDLVWTDDRDEALTAWGNIQIGYGPAWGLAAFHTQGPDGTPWGYTSTATADGRRLSWAGQFGFLELLTHEINELIGRPSVNTYSANPYTGELVSLENTDAVQGRLINLGNATIGSTTRPIVTADAVLESWSDFYDLNPQPRSMKMLTTGEQVGPGWRAPFGYTAITGTDGVTRFEFGTVEAVLMTPRDWRGDCLMPGEKLWHAANDAYRNNLVGLAA